MPLIRTNRETAVVFIGLLLCLFSLLTEDVHGERLPIKSYDSADGLASSFVGRVVRDSHGFIWICTRNGLSRFDGYRFVNYKAEQGLSDSSVNDLLESHDGAYWIATNGGGVCLFNPEAGLTLAEPDHNKDKRRPIFTVYPVGGSAATNRVNVLYEDRAHQIWAGTDGGLFRLLEENGVSSFQRVALAESVVSPDSVGISAISGDAEGAIWIGTDTSGLFRLWPDGRSAHYTTRDGLPNNEVLSLLNDRGGAMWAGTIDGACQFALDATNGQAVVTRSFSIKDGLGANLVRGLYQTSDKRIWLSTDGGLTEFDGQRFRNHTTANGLTDQQVTNVTEDREGDLWIGTIHNGVMRVARNGFSSYGTGDGVGLDTMHSLWETQRGELLAIGESYFITRFDGSGIKSIRPALPRLPESEWGSQTIFLDHQGCFWVLTKTGLYRFPKVASLEQLADMPPIKIYTTSDGLAGDDVFLMFEDSHDDIWISTTSTTRNRLTRWERATETFHVYSEADGVPPFNAPSAFCEDRLGNLWIGLTEGGLVRYANGRFTVFGAADGLPGGRITALYRDRENRLWLGSNRSGLTRIDDTGEPHPRFVPYASALDLITNDVRCITEDLWGRLYLGTSHGVYRLDPPTGNVKHFTKADGLSDEFVTAALGGRSGSLWFATLSGVSKLVPQLDHPEPPPTVLINGLRVAGVKYGLSELGETVVSGLRLDANQNQIQIEFGGLAFDLSDVLRFQYQLEGVDRDWSAPTDLRMVNYVSLAPGSYRFLLRAINDDGVASESPAVISFTVLPPIWQRWWFVLLSVSLLAASLYAIYRYRVARLLELERVRSHIAADLHDDIGSSLSQISVLSEVLRKQLGTEGARVGSTLSLMSRVSGEALDSMSDIVWAINPQQDRLHDLVIKMRRFASEILPARNIEFSFIAPGDGHDLKLTPAIRRQVYLVLKESINNAVRHAACTRVEIELSMADGALVLCVTDNGRGFDQSLNADGQGLRSMRRRAASIDGAFTLSSPPGGGTKVLLKVPYTRRFWKNGAGPRASGGETGRSGS